MNFQAEVNAARQKGDFNSLLKLVPYAEFIGMEIQMLGEELFFVLPPKESNVGNPVLPALHGGVIGGFMENAAIFHIISLIETDAIPKVVDFSLDYLRPARFQTTYCSCSLVRQGRKVMNVSVTAWQRKHSEPVANARTHLLL